MACCATNRLQIEVSGMLVVSPRLDDRVLVYVFAYNVLLCELFFSVVPAKVWIGVPVHTSVMIACDLTPATKGYSLLWHYIFNNCKLCVFM